MDTWRISPITLVSKSASRRVTASLPAVLAGEALAGCEDVEVSQSLRPQAKAVLAPRHSLLVGRLIHGGVLAFDVNDNHRPAIAGRLLDDDLGRVRLARADGAEDAEVGGSTLLLRLCSETPM